MTMITTATLRHQPGFGLAQPQYRSRRGFQHKELNAFFITLFSAAKAHQVRFVSNEDSFCGVAAVLIEGVEMVANSATILSKCVANPPTIRPNPISVLCSLS